MAGIADLVRMLVPTAIVVAMVAVMQRRSKRWASQTAVPFERRLWTETSIVLPAALRERLVGLGERLDARWPVNAELDIPDLHALPPEHIVRLELEIVSAARLFHSSRMVRSGLFDSKRTPLQQLETVPGLEYLFIFHADGHFREAALRKIAGPLPSAFAFAAIAWRLNDWVPEVRAAAVECAARTFPVTAAGIVAAAAMALLRRENSWGRWTTERTLLAKAIERPEVAAALAEAIIARRTGPGATVLRQALKGATFDRHLPRIARSAAQPSIRAIAAQALIDGITTWPDGWEWRWIDKSMGNRRREPRLGRRNFQPTVPRQELIEACARDRAATVRKIALASLIRYDLVSPEARRIATALVDDPSRAVRERAAFILQRNAEAGNASSS